LAVVHLPGDGDQQKPEWVEHSLRNQNPLSRPQAAVAKYRILMKIQFPDHTGSWRSQSWAGSIIDTNVALAEPRAAVELSHSNNSFTADLIGRVVSPTGFPPISET
jgi:hypothetical protein